MFENPRRGRQARNFTANVPKILDLESSSEQMFFFRKLTLHGCPRFQSSHHKTPFAYNQSLQHLTIAVLLIKISVVFTCSKVTKALKRSKIVSIKQRSLISPNLHRLRWECLAQLLPFSCLLCHKYKEKRVADYESGCLRKRD